MPLALAAVAGQKFLSLHLLAVRVVELNHHFGHIPGVETHPITDLDVVGEGFAERRADVRLIIREDLLAQLADPLPFKVGVVLDELYFPTGL